MALKRITEEEMNAQGVIAAPDILNGTPAQNKAIFDRMVRSLVAPAVNACVDAVEEVQNAETGVEEAEEKRRSAETERVLAEENRSEAEQDREAAEQERREAEEERQNAETGYVKQAQDSAVKAESWAVGGTGTREGEDANNAKYWAEKAQATAAGGDMQSAVYDPQGKKQDIFAYAMPASSKGNPDGVASLDGEGKVPKGQLPEISSVKVYEAAIGTAWTENEDTGVKTQTVAIAGITAENTAKVDHSSASVDGTSDGYAIFVEEENQYLNYITNGFAETVAGGIKFTIFGDAPTVSIPIVVEVV